MRVAVVGGGISGLSAALMLSRQHDVTLFDDNPWLGGHTHTVDVFEGDQRIAVDTGFIVFNDRTYPNFLDFLDRLGVGRQDSDMSFSVRCDTTGVEYNGSTLMTLFARPANAVSPKFLRMLRDIVSFNKRVIADVDQGRLDNSVTLAEYISQENYGEWLSSKYIGPMVAAIWSSSVSQALAMPVAFFGNFFVNHGLLDIVNRPQWYVVPGGSRSYVDVIAKRLGDRIRSNTPVAAISRRHDGVDITTTHGEVVSADHVVIATHTDQALNLLQDPSDAEARILGQMPYTENHVVLHTDTSVLPKRPKAWASWNYFVRESAGFDQTATQLSYNMNMLQSLACEKTYCVTLNPARAMIRDDAVIEEFNYSHPAYSEASIAAAAKINDISGVNRTSYCGAFWRNGFHEDGLVSAINAVAPLGASLSDV